MTGANGEVGWGIANAATDAGAHVVLPTRSEGGVARLSEEFGELATVVHPDVSTDAGVERVLAACDERGRLHHVAAPIGSFWNGGMTLDQEPDATRVERRPRDGVVPSIAAGRFFVGIMCSDLRSETIRFDGERGSAA